MCGCRRGPDPNPPPGICTVITLLSELRGLGSLASPFFAKVYVHVILGFAPLFFCKGIYNHRINLPLFLSSKGMYDSMYNHRLNPHPLFFQKKVYIVYNNRFSPHSHYCPPQYCCKDTLHTCPQTGKWLTAS
jgi:hypothetical protein